MFNGTWGIKEGFAACVALAVVGCVLQFAAGPVDWGWLAWPANALALAAYVAALLAVYAFGRKTRAGRWAMSYSTAVPALAAVVAVTLLMGLVKQTPMAAGGGMLHHMLQFWPFVLAYFWMATVLGLVCIKRLFHFRIKDIPFLLNHLGLFIVLLAATLGSADLQRLRMATRIGHAERLAYDSQGSVRQMPMSIELREFTLDQYPPKLLLISNATGQAMDGSILLDDATSQGELPGWRIEILDRRQAYEQAAYVKATSTGGSCTATGWVSSGGLDRQWQDLMLDSACSLVMLEGEPRRFASRVAIATSGSEQIEETIEVNKPARVGSWKIYLIGYDESMGRWSDACVFELVSDPWLPIVYTGLIMMMLGAACMFAVPRRSEPKDKER